MNTIPGKILGAVLSVLMPLLLLTGCGAAFDAQALVQGELDMIYHQAWTEESLETLGLTEEEAQARRDQEIAQRVEEFCAYYDLDPELYDSEVAQQLEQLCSRICDGSSYTVGESVKEGDSYFVEVTVAPIALFQTVAEEDGADFSQAWADRYTQGEFDDATPAEIETAWAQAILDLVSARVEDMGFLEPETIRVEVLREEDGSYAVSESDLTNLDHLLAAYGS